MLSDMWILANVVVPIFIVVAAFVVALISNRAAKKHRDK